MKILYTNFHTHHKGGHATYILNLAESLKNQHEIHIADPATSGLHSEAQKLYPGKVFAQDYPKRASKLISILKSAWQLRQLIKQNRYDLVHVNGSPDLQMTLMACFLLKNKPKIVYTKHNSIPISRNYFSVRKFKGAAEIIVVCGCQKQDFIQVGIPENRITVIKNGLDTEHFAPPSASTRAKSRKELRLTDQDFVILSSAGTAPYKRWEQMIKAVSQIKNPHLKIVFVGGTPSSENQERYVKALNMQDRVIFVGEVIDTRPFVAAGDMGFVLSDEIETVSFACREMMSMGLPMLVSNFACLPENVTVGENGWIVPTGDITGMKKIIEWAYAHRERLPAMGKKAREQAVREFGIELFVKQTEAVYQKALKPWPYS